MPGTSASIITEAGQVYYVFVVNTGSSTDIKIDGTNLGISNNDITGFTYYPNPTSGILYLKSIDKIDSVEIFNMLGQKVLENKLKVNTAQLDISDLSFGTYIMKAMVNGKTATFKVVKN